MYLNVNAIFLGEAWQVLIGCVGFECRKLWSLGTGGFWVSSRPTVLNSCQSKHKGRTRVSVAPTNSRGIRLNSTGNVKITMMAVTFCQQRCTVSFLWTKSRVRFPCFVKLIRITLFDPFPNYDLKALIKEPSNWQKTREISQRICFTKN